MQNRWRRSRRVYHLDTYFMFNVGARNVNRANLELVLVDQLVVELVVKVDFTVPGVYREWEATG